MYLNYKNILFSILLLQSFLFANPNSQEIITLQTIEEKSIKYISLVDFCRANNLKYSYYESKEKFEIIYKNNKLYFSPLSSYMKINNKSYHMLYPSLLKQNVIFVPVITFYKILEKEKLPTQFLDSGTNYIQALKDIKVYVYIKRII